MERFEAENLVVESKPDLTPVSDADIACEKLLRERLAEVRPDDEVLGEEFGGEATFGGRQWVIDPIDGTKNFVRKRTGLGNPNCAPGRWKASGRRRLSAGAGPSLVGGERHWCAQARAGRHARHHPPHRSFESHKRRGLFYLQFLADRLG